MQKALAWASAILGLAALIFAIIFFRVTQRLDERDWTALSIGAVLGATIVAIISAFVFNSDKRRLRIDSETAVAKRKANLVQALPLRSERLMELREQAGDIERSLEVARGNEKSLKIQAGEAAQNRMMDLAEENLAASKTWGLRASELETQLPDAISERNRVEKMSDVEFSAEAKCLRGLD